MGGETARPNNSKRQNDATVARSRSEANTIAYQPPEPGPLANPLAGGDDSRRLEFGRYRIVRQLGAGAMGAVYLAHDTQLDRRIALKTPSFGGSPEPEAIQRFYREARLAATLRHPNICPIYDVGEIDGVHFISMAFLEGRPLSDYIRPEKPVPQHGAAMAVRKLASALQHAHEHGVIHRDLKPANIMVDKSREPIVMDFGLARRADTAGETLKTQTGVIMGTPLYMSPEQVEGEPEGIGPASDQYSLGVILYELITSQRPFAGSFASLVAKIATQPPPAPSEHRADVDEELAAICLKMMAKKPDDRFGSMKEAADALGAYVKGTVQPSAVSPASQSASESNDDDLGEAAPPRSGTSETPSGRRAAKAADAELQEFLALQSMIRKASTAPSTPPRPDAAPSGRKQTMPSAAIQIMAGGPAAIVLMFGAFWWLRPGRELALSERASESTAEQLVAAVPPTPVVATEPALPERVSPPVAQPSPERPLVYRANEWIDVIPLIDPQRDKFTIPQLMGRNEWHMHNGELSVGPDSRASKLLFPLVLYGPSLEWEIEFTRISGSTPFSTDVPAGNILPIVVGGRNPERITLGTIEFNLPPHLRAENSVRQTLRVSVQRLGDTDRIELFVNDESVGVWTGDREAIGMLFASDDNYSTAHRTGLYVTPRNEFVFHRIRLRMLEGKARPVDDTSTRERPYWTDLFNGHDLSGWQAHGDGQWHVRDGAIMAGGNAHGMLVREETFRDFELTLEVLADSRGNGGIFFHLPFDNGSEGQSYELQLAGSKGDRANYTGGVYRAGKVVVPVNPPVAPDARWVTLGLRVIGNRIQTYVDRELVVDYRGDAEFLRGGYLGLQGRSMPPGVRVGYRNLRVHRLDDEP